MNRRILLLSLPTLACAILAACGNGYNGPPGSKGGALTVQLVQPPPTSLIAGGTAGLAATVLNDTGNGSVTWSCTPAGACGTFNPTTTGYQIGTLYTAPVAAPNGAVTPNLNYSVTITATSMTDSSQSASATITIPQRYSIILSGYASLGMVGSVILDGHGNITSGEADWSQNGAYSGMGLTGTYSLDATGHGVMSLNLINTIYGSFPQTQGITATSNSHLVIAEEDQFNGLTIGGVGSMDLQTAGPNFSTSQIAGGYSFTLAGYSKAKSANSSWGGIFTADGAGNITGGVFDENAGGGTGYASIPFTGTYTAPDASGRGVITLSATPDTPSASTQYAYYIVTPGTLRLTTMSNVGNAANTGSAFSQGSVATTNAALTGNFIFSDYGFTSVNNGGQQGAAAGQFTTDGSGNITAGIMDLNAFGTVTTSSLANSTYSISGSPRGTATTSPGQTYNIYLTDPNLNLLDPNNTTGTGGALLLETDAATTVGLVIPQTDSSATLSGGYATFLSDQANPPNADGGLTGQFTVSTTTSGTFNGEGDFQGMGSSNATPIVGPLTGTFTADGANPGRFTGTITTAPAFPLANVGDTTPGTENVSFYLANGSQGFVVETDSIAPVFGVVEGQGTIQSGKKAQRARQQARSSKASGTPVNSTTTHPEVSRRTR